MISNRCARKYLVTNCNSIISKNYLRFLVDSNVMVFTKIEKVEGRKPNLFEFCAEPYPILCKDNESYKYPPPFNIFNLY